VERIISGGHQGNPRQSGDAETSNPWPCSGRDGALADTGLKPQAAERSDATFLRDMTGLAAPHGMEVKVTAATHGQRGALNSAGSVGGSTIAWLEP
jgi:hypothetical protein